MSVPLSPDECVIELTQLAKHFDKSATQFRDSGPIAETYRRRAAAIRWVLELNAYGVPEHEVVT